MQPNDVQKAEPSQQTHSADPDAAFPAPSTHAGPAHPNLSGCIDLHFHSTCSDGAMEPEQLVEWASQLGLRAISLTDHDTTAGVDRAMKRGKELGVEVIPGIEISVSYSGGTFHLLGYFMDHHDDVFNTTMRRLVEMRDDRNRKIVQALKDNGMEITQQELLAEAGEAVVGRPHIAKIMIRKGYVKTFPEAFDKWIGEGKPCHFEKENFLPPDAIALVRAAGGVAVMAHPCWLNRESLEDLERYLAELKEHGLAGMEVVYPDHSPELQEQYLAIAKRLGLVVTGGSDFHGGDVVKPEVTLGHGCGGGFRIPGELLKALRDRVGVA